MYYTFEALSLLSIILCLSQYHQASTYLSNLPCFLIFQQHVIQWYPLLLKISFPWLLWYKILLVFLLPHRTFFRDFFCCFFLLLSVPSPVFELLPMSIQSLGGFSQSHGYPLKFPSVYVPSSRLPSEFYNHIHKYLTNISTWITVISNSSCLKPSSCFSSIICSAYGAVHLSLELHASTW